MERKSESKGQEQLLKEITSLLGKFKIPYMVTGSLSVIFYGRPRASHDIDFIIEAERKDTERIKGAFLSLPHGEFIVDTDMIEHAISKKFQFNILHLPTMLKLDFWLLTGTDFDKTRFKRRENIYTLGQSMVFSTPEDTILIKLMWYKESKIEKHLIDAAFIYQIQEERLDKDYLEKWTKKQKIEKLLSEIEQINLEQHY